MDDRFRLTAAVNRDQKFQLRFRIQTHNTFLFFLYQSNFQRTYLPTLPSDQNAINTQNVGDAAVSNIVVFVLKSSPTIDNDKTSTHNAVSVRGLMFVS